MYGAWVLAVRLILVILSLRFFYVDYQEGGRVSLKWKRIVIRI